MAGDLLVGLRVQHLDDGAGQHSQAHPGGQGQQSAHAQGGLGDLAGADFILLRQGRRDGGNDAGRQGDHEGRGQVVDGDGLLVAAVQAYGQLLGVAQGALQQVLDLHGV